MRISLNWLKEFVALDVSVEALCDKLTMLGLTVEAVERLGEDIQNVVVGEILSIEPHPDADKLVVCRTDVGGGEPLQIVCGAKNMKVGDKAPTALVGATLPGDFKIGKRKMRGVESQGMMCSARELKLGEDHAGLLILDPKLKVGQDVREVLGLSDTIIEVEVTPNRGDWASMIGVARELAAAYGKPLKLPEFSVGEGSVPAVSLSSVAIEDPDLCPRYVGRLILSVKIGPSPDWLVKRLAAAGQRAINNVVDVTNFVLLETGHPLHAFDLDTLAEKRIVVRRAKPGETIQTIDHETRKLGPDMLIIADATRPVAVAGVMGGAETEVGEKTRNIFLESAYFNPASIRRTSRALGLATESSQRFQRGADPEMALYAANRAAQLIRELAGGEIAQGALDVYPKPLERKRVTLRYRRSDALLGMKIPPEAQRSYLLGLGFTECQQSAETLTVETPTWRHDVSHETDLIEEVARLHGYDRVGPTLPRVRPTDRVYAPMHAWLERLRDILVGMGLTEVMNWTFGSPEDPKRMGLNGPEPSMVALSNPLSENHAIMRASLLPGILNTVALNIRKGRKDLKIFELGPVYRPASDGSLPVQHTRLAIALTGHSDRKHWSRPQYPVDFYDLKGILERLFETLGHDAAFQETNLACYAPARRAAINLKSPIRPIGHIGLAADAVRVAFDIGQPVFLGELDLDALFKAPAPVPQFTEIPMYPPSLRDLAIVVDETTPAGDILDIARKSGGKLLKAIEIFDIYTGKPVPEGKKSVALSLMFQSDERTLTDEDTQKTLDKVIRSLTEQFGAQLR